MTTPLEDQNRKEINKILARPLALTAGISGLVQGIVWTVLSALSLCCYFQSIEIEVTTDPGAYYLSIYEFFLNPDGVHANSQIQITPREFSIFMWLYLVLSILWLVDSTAIIWAMTRDKWNMSKTFFGSWSILAILISIVDLVLTVLIGLDYNTIDDSNILTIYGIVLALAARGFILWIINVIFAIILGRFAIQIIRKENKVSRLPVINGFDNGEVTPSWFNSDVKSFWASHDNQGFQRTESFVNLPMPDTYDRIAESYLEPIPSTSNAEPTSFAEAIAQKTATIGRNKGLRSPGRNVAVPIIPPPDYTPPQSPTMLKSVLKAPSHY